MALNHPAEWSSAVKDEYIVRQFAFDTGAGVATMAAVKALNAALVEAGLFPGGRITQIFNDMVVHFESTHADGTAEAISYKQGMEYAARVMGSDSPDGPQDGLPPGWLRGVIDGGKATDKE